MNLLTRYAAWVGTEKIQDILNEMDMLEDILYEALEQSTKTFKSR